MGSGRRAHTPRLLNRELSWLDFNARVLALAEDERTPLLERAKFAAIFATNLDEFFMVRVAGLQRQVAAGVTVRSPDGLRPGELLEAVLARAADLAARHARAWTDGIRPALAHAGIRIAAWADLATAERAGLAGLFAARVFPVLTPLAVDPAHPFPFISNRSLNLAVRLHDPVRGQNRFARITVPPILERFLIIGQGGPSDVTVLPIEELIGGNLERLFPGMEVIGQDTFRVTRDAELAIDDDDAEDLLRTVEDGLRRVRTSPAVRLELATGSAPETEALLGRELGLAAASVHALPEPLGLGSLWELHRLDRPELKDPTFTSAPAPALRADLQGEVEIFERLDAAEVLVQHPYESFAGSVQAFIEQAADDAQVLAIKQTLYRTTADPIVNALVRAAEAGKQVVVLVELKARFDEENNVAWARILERAGCHVVYGVSGLKTHAKLVLVVRREGEAIRRYVHVGTGNYNAATAREYEDLGLLSADPLLAREVGELFNLLSGYAHRAGAERVMVAPFDLRQRLLARIGAETEAARAGHAARVVVKCNALTDPTIIEALYAASEAGVEVDAVVRGICMLRPERGRRGGPIRVRSILGRFLEHSRIYQFGVAPATETWIGSADLMERNLDRRVEVLVRIDDEAQRLRLAAILEDALRDPTAWTLGPDGAWSRGRGADGSGLQASLLEAVRPLDQPGPEEPIVAAGGVVWRRAGPGIEVAIVHRPRYDDWSLPKGKLGAREDALSAALREVAEETGMRVRVGPPLGETRYRKLTPTGSRPKVVHWWAMEATGGGFTPGDEVDDMRWLSTEEAALLVTRLTDRDLLARFDAITGMLSAARG